jgi:hypothetical protein
LLTAPRRDPDGPNSGIRGHADRPVAHQAERLGAVHGGDAGVGEQEIERQPTGIVSASGARFTTFSYQAVSLGWPGRHGSLA